jgi:hypothetical protein
MNPKDYMMDTKGGKPIKSSGKVFAIGLDIFFGSGDVPWVFSTFCQRLCEMARMSSYTSIGHTVVCGKKIQVINNRFVLAAGYWDNRIWVLIGNDIGVNEEVVEIKEIPEWWDVT